MRRLRVSCPRVGRVALWTVAVVTAIDKNLYDLSPDELPT